MKTGRPEIYIPSASQVSRDVKLVFARTRQRIAKMLQVSLLFQSMTRISTHTRQEYDGRLSFATDAWTSPNHYAYVAVTVHLEMNGLPISIVLDVVELAESHNGLNLAIAFQRILEDFGIDHKVS